ncbi:hypothetical protein DEDE109153_16545 [Deinococcus deserti]|uniref:Uncharacterized protein n=1 Tax=Deinococcus deserti (strain DSM 17065 / CIP 109153 / LMG 22923 / VCD115) TaxID=546414 RepID=C1D0K5_DEIDV|nr:hypothetical protein [Deinococcus deserti]ACO45379.1 hypothetical protein Deide_05410 [Deinococcus deserti VCD115]
MRFTLPYLCLASLLLTGGLAAATTAPTLTLAQQAKKAEVIVRATLGAPVTVNDGEVTYIAYPLNITETVLGDAARLPQHEGRPALMFLQGLQDLPALKTGQEVIALLYARRLDSPLVGFNQGLYAVTDGKVNAGDITDPVKLRDAIRAAREGQ